MTFGVSPTGFTPKTVQDVLASLQAKHRAGEFAIDPNILTSAETLLGQLDGAFASEMAEAWEAVDALANQFNPDDAEGVYQDMIAALTGTVRLKATKGEVTINLQSSGATTWPAGTIVAQEDNPDNLWLLDTAVVAGGAGTFPGKFTASVAGKIEGPASTLTVRVSSVPSWIGASNPADAAAGRNVETQTELAIRREEELRSLGGASEPAIAADVEEVAPSAIRSVRVLVNDGDTVDVNGLPGHSFEAVIYDPAPEGPVDDDVIAQTIWDTKALGIQTSGFESGNALTKASETKVVKFTRPSVREIFTAVSVIIDPLTFPVDGDEQIKQALKNESGKWLPGDTVHILRNIGVVLSVQGVVDIPVYYQDLDTPAVLFHNLLLTVREIAHVDTANITVTHV